MMFSPYFRYTLTKFGAKSRQSVWREQPYPGNLPKNPDEMRKNRLSSGFSPQKHGWKAQRKVREPSGFVRGPSFESMAGVFAIDGARRLTSVRLAYSPHAMLIDIL